MDLRSRSPLLLLLALVAGLVSAPPASGSTITLRVSVKIIRDAATGLLPPIEPSAVPPATQPRRMTHQQVQDMITTANERFLGAYWRGYRFQVVEVIDIGTVCTTCPDTNPSRWSQIPIPNDNSASPNLRDFETVAKVTPAFAWNTSAINVFFNAGMGNGAVSSFPPPDTRANDTVLFGSMIFDPGFNLDFSAETFVHEVGHYFALNHPHRGGPTCCTANSTCIGDGDGIADTLGDGQCFDRDDLAQYHFGKSYAALTPGERVALDDIYENVMTYNHPDQPYGRADKQRMTEGQCDVWTDTANSIRLAVRTGRTRFVAKNGSPTGNGSSGSPRSTVLGGLALAVPGDIVLVRPGVYAENLTLSAPITLRATRSGPVTIGQ